MKKINIYFIEQNGVVLYVGRTINPKRRNEGHNTSLGKCSLVVVHECDIKEASFWEAHYIWLFRSYGFVLKNLHKFERQKYVRRKKLKKEKQVKERKSIKTKTYLISKLEKNKYLIDISTINNQE